MRQIEEFLDEYRRRRVIIESTVRATLNRTLEFEDKLQKPFYEFSEDEILNIFKSFHAISVVSVQNANLLLKHASRWMIDKHQLINGKKAKILLEHCLFDKQIYYCEELCVINDDKRIGVVIHGNEIFVDKQNIRLVKNHDNLFMLFDVRLTITVIVNKM